MTTTPDGEAYELRWKEIHWEGMKNTDINRELDINDLLQVTMSWVEKANLKVLNTYSHALADFPGRVYKVPYMCHLIVPFSFRQVSKYSQILCNFSRPFTK